MLTQSAMSDELSDAQRAPETEALVFKFAELIQGKNSNIAMDAVGVVATAVLRNGWKNEDERKVVLWRFYRKLEYLSNLPRGPGEN